MAVTGQRRGRHKKYPLLLEPFLQLDAQGIMEFAHRFFLVEWCGPRWIVEAGPRELAGSGRVTAGYAKFSRSGDFGVRFGVRFGPNDPNVPLGKRVKIGGAGRNRMRDSGSYRV